MVVENKSSARVGVFKHNWCHRTKTKDEITNDVAMIAMAPLKTQRNEEPQ